MASKVKRSKETEPCPFCGKTCKKLSHLLDHIHRHTGEKPFECGTCGKEFSTKGTLKTHLAIHSSARPRKCKYPECNKTFKTQSSLNSHENRTHRVDKHFPCVFCQHTQRSKIEYFIHLRYHINEKPYVCGVCGSEKNRTSLLKDHYLWCHTDERPYKCDPCQISFPYKSYLRHHDRTVHSTVPVSRGQRLLRCVECNEKFRTPRLLEIHKVLHTGIDKPYKCFICGKGFYANGELQGHMRVHTGEKPFKCDKCSSNFASLNGLKYHLQTHNPTRVKYSCDECAKSFGTTSRLRRHVKQDHRGEGFKGCLFCPRKFDTAASLSRHLLGHTRERPYICKVCGVEHRFRPLARSHTLRLHGRGSLYKCEYCENKYFSVPSLRAHQIKFHDGKRNVKSKVVVQDYLLYA